MIGVFFEEFKILIGKDVLILEENNLTRCMKTFTVKV